MWFQKVSHFPHNRSLEIPRGRGVVKAEILEEKYEAELEFPAEVGAWVGGWCS